MTLEEIIATSKRSTTPWPFRPARQPSLRNMAQWNGQYSGLTHATKVQDIEESLRMAVAAFCSACDAQRTSKAKAIYHLAERLLAARTKDLRARLSALRDLGTKHTTSKQCTRLQAREQELHAHGVAGILQEFHFHGSTIA